MREARVVQVVASAVKHKVKVPLMFVGAKGRETTAFEKTVRFTAKAMGLPVAVIRCESLNSIIDLRGTPYKTAVGETAYRMPTWLNKLRNGGILVLENVTQCQGTVATAIIQIIGERRFEKYILNPDVVIVGTATPLDGWGYVDEGILYRCCLIHMTQHAATGGMPTNIPTKTLTYRGVCQFRNLLPVISDFTDMATEVVLGTLGQSWINRNEHAVKSRQI